MIALRPTSTNNFSLIHTVHLANGTRNLKICLMLKLVHFILLNRVSECSLIMFISISVFYFVCGEIFKLFLLLFFSQDIYCKECWKILSNQTKERSGTSYLGSSHPSTNFKLWNFPHSTFAVRANFYICNMNMIMNQTLHEESMR